MSLALATYKLATRALSPFLKTLLVQRAKRGKEDFGRIHERFARQLPPRLDGPLIWLHGASVGESLLLLELGNRLLAERPDLMLLFTSQTQTSAHMLGPRLPDHAFHTMAPLDTPAIARRFIQHWKPDLLILGESEIWPNLLDTARKAGVKRALVNARMTEKSAKGWQKWNGLFRRLLGGFDVILTADTDTSARLQSLLNKPIKCAGNLKSAQSVPSANMTEYQRLSESFVGERRCLLAASTHEGEDITFLDAVETSSDIAIIIAPRHPERGDEIEALLKTRRLPYARRSRHEAPNQRTRVLLADTLGEMGLWFRLADAVYLGGGHKNDVGGHNPLEPVRLGKPVVTGPHTFNFRDVMQDLEQRGMVETAVTPERLGEALSTAKILDATAVDLLNTHAESPMVETLAALRPFLPAPEDPS